MPEASCQSPHLRFWEVSFRLEMQLYKAIFLRIFRIVSSCVQLYTLAMQQLSVVSGDQSGRLHVGSVVGGEIVVRAPTLEY